MEGEEYILATFPSTFLTLHAIPNITIKETNEEKRFAMNYTYSILRGSLNQK